MVPCLHRSAISWFAKACGQPLIPFTLFQVLRYTYCNPLHVHMSLGTRERVVSGCDCKRNLFQMPLPPPTSAEIPGFLFSFLRDLIFEFDTYFHPPVTVTEPLWLNPAQPTNGYQRYVVHVLYIQYRLAHGTYQLHITSFLNDFPACEIMAFKQIGKKLLSR